MKLNLKMLDCLNCKCHDMWFKTEETARCIDCSSDNLMGNHYSFYINISLERGLYLVITEHGQDDNTSYPTENRIYTLQFNGLRSGYVQEEIKIMAEKVLTDYTKNHFKDIAEIVKFIKKKMKGESCET